MDSTGLLSLLREELMDQEEPYLWSDEFLLACQDDAQLMFCRETDGIPDDATPEVVEIEVTPGSDRVALHPSIRLIRAAQRGDTGAPIEVVNTEDMARRGWRFDGAAGMTRALVIGGSANAARVWPVASEAYTLQLTVFRLPLTSITDTDQPFEVSAEHHRHLSLWCRHLAYDKPDSDAYDKGKSTEYASKFHAYCEKVNREEQRKRHKTRVVSYGGL